MRLSSVIEPGNVEIQQRRDPVNVKIAATYKLQRRPYLEVTTGATILKGIPSPYDTVRIRVISFEVDPR